MMWFEKYVSEFSWNFLRIFLENKEQELVHLEAEEDTSSEQSKLEKKLRSSVERRIKALLEIKVTPKILLPIIIIRILWRS